MGEKQNPSFQFRVVDSPNDRIPKGRFLLATERGKQFNNMVDVERDTITGAGRDAILRPAEDAALLLGVGCLEANGGPGCHAVIEVVPVRRGGAAAAGGCA